MIFQSLIPLIHIYLLCWFGRYLRDSLDIKGRDILVAGELLQVWVEAVTKSDTRNAGGMEFL